MKRFNQLVPYLLVAGLFISLYFLIPSRSSPQITNTSPASGPTDPSTCSPTGNALFWNTTTAQLKGCTAPNTWTSMIGSGGSPSFNTINALNYQINGSAMPLPSTCADSAGQHLNYNGSAYVCGSSTPTGMVTQNGAITAGHEATWNASGVIQDSGQVPALPTLSGTTGSIGGGLLSAGSCATGTATVSGATTSMVAVAQPSDGTNIQGVGVNVSAVVTSSNTVTVSVCALLIVTPAAKTYNVRVLQ